MTRVYTFETVKKIGEAVLVKGWVHVRRDMGKIIFIDLRDKEGLLQVVLTPQDLSEEEYTAAKELRPEWVVRIEGTVEKRGEKQANPKLATGTVEVLASRFKVLNKAETPPFEITNDTLAVNEELRLKHRYLDLRSERMKNNLKLRHRIIHYIRNYLIQEGFTEVQTPILTKSTPEGARDYLVPSRKHLGKFFALPQAPQQYKQLLMVAGLEKYFQIAPCFRDEDARADRSPGEFYQLDVEVSFIEQNDILELLEELYTKLVKEIFPEKKIIFKPWPRFEFDEVMKKYNTDKPDLRENKNDPDELAFAWIINFPLLVEQTKGDHFHGSGDRYAPSHNMFTMPKENDIHLLDTNPLEAKSYQHDLVLNGYEVGGGAMRIHDPRLQEKVFELIGFDEKQKKQFKHLLEAFEYGVPPHGGIACGIDRIIAVLAGEKSIREVIAFPLTAEARDPLMNAPAEVSKNQLDELGIKIVKS